jgi:monofunctional biosynthetic peptidoglycan transglycosylase
MKNLFGPAPRRLLVPAGLSLLFAMKIHATADKIVYDFQNTTNTAAWQVVNDDVMGGVSTSSFRLTNGVALFQGKVSLENNGGFASVRSLPGPHDLAGSEAFFIRVRGDGHSYKLTARTGPDFDSAIYQSVFTTKKGEWEEHRLPFKQFIPTYRGRVLTGEPPLDPAHVTSLGFLISDKQDGPFQLEVAWIKVTSLSGR